MWRTNGKAAPASRCDRRPSWEAAGAALTCALIFGARIAGAHDPASSCDENNVCCTAWIVEVSTDGEREYPIRADSYTGLVAKQQASERRRQMLCRFWGEAADPSDCHTVYGTPQCYTDEHIGPAAGADVREQLVDEGTAQVVGRTISTLRNVAVEANLLAGGPRVAADAALALRQYAGMADSMRERLEAAKRDLDAISQGIEQALPAPTGWLSLYQGNDTSAIFELYAVNGRFGGHAERDRYTSSPIPAAQGQLREALTAARQVRPFPGLEIPQQPSEVKLGGGGSAQILVGGRGPLDASSMLFPGRYPVAAVANGELLPLTIGATDRGAGTVTTLRVGGGVGMTLELSYFKDGDHDGAPDDRDRCPAESARTPDGCPVVVPAPEPGRYPYAAR